MSTSLFRATPVARSALRAASAVKPAAATFVRGKATLPDLQCEFSYPLRIACRGKNLSSASFPHPLRLPIRNSQS